MEHNKAYHVINLKLDRVNNDLVVSCQLVSADNEVIPLGLYVNDLLHVPELLANAVDKETLSNIEDLDTKLVVEKASPVSKPLEDSTALQEEPQKAPIGVKKEQQETSRLVQPVKSQKRTLFQFSKVHKLPEEVEEGGNDLSEDKPANRSNEETDKTTVVNNPKPLVQLEEEQPQQVPVKMPTEKTTPVTQDPIFGSSNSVSLSDDESAAVIADMGDFSDKRAALIREQYGKVVD